MSTFERLRVAGLEDENERLRTENAALRVERDYERARLAEWRDAAAAGLLPTPRAHDLGVPQAQARMAKTLGELFGTPPRSIADAFAKADAMQAAGLLPVLTDEGVVATHAAPLPAKAMR